MTVHLKTTLGICAISGDENGILEIKILDVEKPQTEVIPEILISAVNQIEDYFNRKLQHFSFKLNSTGTVFQKKVWQELNEIPFG